MRFKDATVRRVSGFTLVELLVVVIAISILTGIGLPAIRGAHRSSVLARDLENARSVASLVQSAEAAGMAVIDPEGSVEQTIRNLSAGVTGRGGVFDGQTFQVAISGEKIAGAARFLRFRDGLLVYVPD